MIAVIRRNKVLLQTFSAGAAFWAGPLLLSLQGGVWERLP